jgi:hypothetical protein
VPSMSKMANFFNFFGGIAHIVSFHSSKIATNIYRAKLK